MFGLLLLAAYGIRRAIGLAPQADPVLERG
jgi:hypothetical protein